MTHLNGHSNGPNPSVGTDAFGLGLSDAPGPQAPHAGTHFACANRRTNYGMPIVSHKEANPNTGLRTSESRIPSTHKSPSSVPLKVEGSFAPRLGLLKRRPQSDGPNPANPRPEQKTRPKSKLGNPNGPQKDDRRHFSCPFPSLSHSRGQCTRCYSGSNARNEAELISYSQNLGKGSAMR